MIGRSLIAAGALLAAAPAVAQIAPAAPAAPAAAAAPADPARLAIATRVAGRLLPPGTYRQLMKAVTDQAMQLIVDKMMDMPLRDVVKMAGISDADAAKLGPGTSRQVLQIMDPAFEKRMQITMHVMGDELANLMDQLEPEYRAGLADALAVRFTPDQLTELDRFFATPTGSAYASQSMLFYADPAMMQRMQAILPKVMQAMPSMIQKVMAATADLPKPRDAKSMTPEQRKQLEALLNPKSASK
jgi:hypothetical protein